MAEEKPPQWMDAAGEFVAYDGSIEAAGFINACADPYGTDSNSEGVI